MRGRIVSDLQPLTCSMFHHFVSQRKESHREEIIGALSQPRRYYPDRLPHRLRRPILNGPFPLFSLLLPDLHLVPEHKANFRNMLVPCSLAPRDRTHHHTASICRNSSPCRAPASWMETVQRTTKVIRLSGSAVLRYADAPGIEVFIGAL